MKVEKYKPKSNILKKYIVSFYFLKSNENKTTEFIYYPHFIDTINLFSNSSVTISSEVFNVRKQENKNEIILSTNKTKFRKAVIINNYDIVGINFKPLAIYNFFDFNNFVTLDQGVFKTTECEELKNICFLNNINEKIDALEDFFINAYKESNKDKIHDIIHLIHSLHGDINMKKLEQNMNLSRRTILRKFQKYLFCSFEDYKNIVRFRLVIENFNLGKNKASNLLNGVPYYDQSSFIHQFKLLTGETPKKLLKYIRNNSSDLNFLWKTLNK